jgi:hypothetical protein
MSERLTSDQLAELDRMAPGGDHRRMSPIWRMQMAQRVIAGSRAGGTEATRLRSILTARHGADESKWPTIERAKLADLSHALTPPPRPVPPVSVADISRRADRDRIERDRLDRICGVRRDR